VHLRIVPNDKLALFMSMVERHLGKRKHPDAPRKGLEDPQMLAATVFSEMKHKGQPVPKEAPPELETKLGKDGQKIWECTRLAGELALARLSGDSARAQQLEDELKDSECDPGWTEALVDYEEYFGPDGRKKAIPYIRFKELDDFVYTTLSPDATVVLLGDWGTGMPPAIELMEQIAAHNPDALIHLGDIYYAGTDREAEDHFLGIIDRYLDRSKTKVYTISGNHEMYSGGAGFYSLIGKLNPDQPQEASFFKVCTTDGKWQFLAMDTALHDHDPFEVKTGMTFLEPDELVWHIDKIDRQHAAGGKTILISHHQLFSAFGTIGNEVYRPAEDAAYNTNLLNAFRTSMAAGKVAAWFWGHEHNLEIYEPYGLMNKGRCIGHGALPVWADDEPYRARTDLEDTPALVKDAAGNEVKLTMNPDGVYDTGFVVVKLAGPKAEVSYYVRSKPGEPIYQEVIE
jgi:predicted phosphodiesterase